VHHLSDFDYELPNSQIAQHPLPDRSASRLLVLDRASGEMRHLHFRDLPGLIPSRDVLVINTSRVIPARLHGKRDTGSPAELLLIREQPDGSWLAMGHPGGKLKPGRRVTFGDDSAVEILEVLGGGLRRVRFAGPLDARATLAKYGEVPLPPYIRRAPDQADSERYQTVYAAHDGSVAAPTAGLHFTQPLLDRIAARGIEWLTVTLHVGPGTFLPVKTDDPRQHPMHGEWGVVSAEAAARINRVRAGGGRVVAIGTTSLRLLESGAAETGEVQPFAGETRLFILPGYRFRAIDLLLTNFHLPRSTLLMLVAALAGLDRIKAAYAHAVAARYRFFSYGDACLIERSVGPTAFREVCAP